MVPSRLALKAASNALGNIFAVADETNRVWLIDDGSFEFVAIGRDVRRIALSRKGSCAISEMARVSVHKRTAEGWQLEYVLENLRDPMGLTWYDDDLIVADSRKVLAFSGRALCCSLESKFLKRASDVAMLPTVDRPPIWWLGRETHEATVALMHDCKIGEWRVRMDSDGELKLCYVSKAAWRRADVDEKPIVTLPDGFAIDIKAEVAIQFFKARGESSEHVPLGVGEYRMKVANLWTALRLCKDSLRLRTSLGDFEGRSKATIAVASLGTDRIILFEYARQVTPLFQARYRYAGQRLNLPSPTNVRFAESGDLVVALKTARSPSTRHIVTLCKPSYHRTCTSNPLGIVEKRLLESLSFVPATSDHMLLLSGNYSAPFGFSSEKFIDPTRNCGSFFDLCLREWLEGLADYLGFADAAATIAPACRSLRALFLDLRRTWRIAPLTPAGLDRAKNLFKAWAWRHEGNRAALPTRRLGRRRLQHGEKSAFQGADRLRFELKNATCSSYALHARRDSTQSTGRQEREEEEGDVSSMLFVDFGRGLFGCVSSIYGSTFWWRWRGLIARHYASLSNETCASKASDSKNSRASSTDAAARLLDMDAFVELWTRLELHARGLSPWESKLPRNFAESDGAKIAVSQTDDDPSRIERALRLGTRNLSGAQADVQLAAYLDVVDYYTRQSRDMINRASSLPERKD